MYKFEYWHVASESFGGQTVKELVKDFNEKHPDIEVVEKITTLICIKALPKTCRQPLLPAKSPDVVQMGWSYLNYAAENLKYQDINQSLKAPRPELLKDNFLPNVLALAQTDDGKQIGVPYSISVPVLYYNPANF